MQYVLSGNYLETIWASTGTHERPRAAVSGTGGQVKPGFGSCGGGAAEDAIRTIIRHCYRHALGFMPKLTHQLVGEYPPPLTFTVP